jgi:hypothetical protein
VVSGQGDRALTEDAAHGLEVVVERRLRMRRHIPVACLHHLVEPRPDVLGEGVELPLGVVEVAHADAHLPSSSPSSPSSSSPPATIGLACQPPQTDRQTDRQTHRHRQPYAVRGRRSRWSQAHARPAARAAAACAWAPAPPRRSRRAAACTAGGRGRSGAPAAPRARTSRWATPGEASSGSRTRSGRRPPAHSRRPTVGECIHGADGDHRIVPDQGCLRVPCVRIVVWRPQYFPPRTRRSQSDSRPVSGVPGWRVREPLAAVHAAPRRGGS